MGVRDDLELSNQFTFRRKRKHDRDSARKVCLKYLKHLERLKKTARQIEAISELTADQADDESGVNG